MFFASSREDPGRTIVLMLVLWLKVRDLVWIRSAPSPDFAPHVWQGKHDAQPRRFPPFQFSDGSVERSKAQEQKFLFRSCSPGNMHSAASHFHPVHEACFEAHLAKLSLRTFHPTLALRSNADLDPRSLGVCGLSFVGEGEEAFVTICPVMNAYSLFERTLVRASERLRRSLA